MPMLNALSLPPRKTYTRSYSIQLMLMSSVPPLCRLLDQQDPLVMMRMNGDACALPLREHLPTFATHLPWWQKGFVHPTWTPKCVSPLLACRLIALNKNPGVRPIGIGDTARRIIAKAILNIARPDVRIFLDASSWVVGRFPGLRLQCMLY